MFPHESLEKLPCFLFLLEVILFKAVERQSSHHIESSKDNRPA
jgi:hypothetical protein